MDQVSVPWYMIQTKREHKYKGCLMFWSHIKCQEKEIGNRRARRRKSINALLLQPSCNYSNVILKLHYYFLE